MEAEADLPHPAHAQPTFVPLVVDDQPPDVSHVVAPPPQIQPRVRGAKFTNAELMNFIEIMESILPIGPTKWDQVWEQHSVVFPDRELNTLRRKYTTLHRKKIPTGDPHMPDEVRMTKRCKYKIAEKAELGDGTGQYDMM